MNTKEIKKFLIDKDLTIAEMARILAPQTTASESSLQQMLSDMFYQRRWYPTLAKKVNTKFGLKLSRPTQYEPKVRFKQTA